MMKDLQDGDYEKKRMLDAPISDKGQLQCELVAKYFQKKQIQATQIRCSPHLRAIQSAKILSEQLQLPIKMMSNIYEIGGNHVQGVGSQGKSRSQFKEEYPDIEIDERITEQGWYSGQLKETKEEAIIRAKQILEEIRQLKGDKFIYISHGNLLDLLLGLIFERDPQSNYYICHQNTGVTMLTYNLNGKFQINYFNDYTHLEMYKLETNVDLIAKFQ